MRIIITGGAGFIGSWLAKRLVERGDQVFIVDNLKTGSIDNIPKEAKFFEFDLTEESVYKKLPQNIDIVYHLASQASGEVSFENPLYDLKVNSLVTLAIMNWSKNNNVNKVIFTSTMGVYADNLGSPANENSPVLPKSFYGINKQASEGYIRIFSEEGMRTSILRLFNVYGPGQNMENLKQGMVSIYLAFINQQKPIVVKGPLDRLRDFVYVEDVVDALILAQNKEADGKVFNVATNRKTSVKELLEIIVSAYEKDLQTYPIEIHERTPRDIDSCYGDNSKIIKELGWRCNVTLEEGVKRMVAWLKKGK